jgi:hypothetical protein
MAELLSTTVRIGIPQRTRRVREWSAEEVAANAISDLVVKIRGPVGFCEDGLPESLGGEADFWSLLDEEDQLLQAAALF